MGVDVDEVISVVRSLKVQLTATEAERIPPSIRPEGQPGPMITRCEERFDSLLDGLDTRLRELRDATSPHA